MVDIKFPFGNGAVFQMTAAGLQELIPSDNMTIIDGHTVPATGNRTLDLDNSARNPSLQVGAMMQVIHTAVAAQTLTFGSGISGPIITGVAGKQVIALFVFDGSTFKQSGASVTLD